MSHPATQLEKNIIRRAKGHLRAGRILPADSPHFARAVGRLGNTAKPCSCWACKRPRYER